MIGIAGLVLTFAGAGLIGLGFPMASFDGRRVSPLTGMVGAIGVFMMGVGVLMISEWRLDQ